MSDLTSASRGMQMQTVRSSAEPIAASMNRRGSSRIAWLLLAVYLAFPIAVPPLIGWFWLRPGYAVSEVFVDVWIVAVLVLPLAAVGAIIAIRRPEHRLGWLMLGIGLIWHVSTLGDVFLGHPTAFHGAAAVWITWMGTWVGLLAVGSMLTTIPLLFPTGRLPSPRWRPVLCLAAIAILLWITHDAFGPSAVEEEALPDALHVAALIDILATTRPLSDVAMVIAVVASIASLLVRFRRAHGVERQQLKWFTFVAGLIPPLFVLAGITAAVDPEDQGGWIGGIGWFGAFACGVIGVPVAMGIAILRYRLYDIDVIINRALVYGSLTATLGLAYAGSILLFQATLQPVIGGSDLAVAALTLASAAVFRPLRGRIQAGVDHRFYRRKYDAARAVESFSNRLRDEVDLQTISAELQTVVQESMQPTHVSLWLQPLRRT